MRAFGRHNSIRRGVTLMELLIVISIMMLLAAVAIPTMRPALEGRRVREAARLVHVFLGSARFRALETGRPCGVILQRFEGQPECAMVLHQAEVPPPYAGDVIDSVVRVQDWTLKSDGSSYWGDGSLILKVQVRDLDFSPGLLRYGDQMRIGHQGPLYTIRIDDPQLRNPPGASSNSGPDFPVDPPTEFIDFTQGRDTSSPLDGWIDTHVLTLRLDPSHRQRVPWPESGGDLSAPWSAPVSFEVFRQPVASAATPLQLPATMVVDLEGSGSDSVDFLPADANNDPSDGLQPDPNDKSVTIMFSPNGSLGQVYLRGIESPVTEPIFLLIGRRENVPAAESPGQENWQDLTNLWVTLNPQTGLVKVAEVAFSANFDPNDPVQRLAAFLASRDFARQAQSKGGR